MGGDGLSCEMGLFSSFFPFLFFPFLFFPFLFFFFFFPFFPPFLFFSSFLTGGRGKGEGDVNVTSSWGSCCLLASLLEEARSSYKTFIILGSHSRTDF